MARLIRCVWIATTSVEGEKRMQPGFLIDYRHSAGNLHVKIHGAFNGMCSWELFKILTFNRRSKRVFVDTQAILQVDAEGVKLFKAQFSGLRQPADWLYFKGKKGFINPAN